MIIGNSSVGYTLRCDSCGLEIKKFDMRREAKAYANENDWQIKKEDNTWTHLCPNCKEE